ncbi:angiopoietin-1 receptor-like, partial [Saccostrea cucullata]|uniref:angiopoietin-1 receptor-like n=1 Tax=Saccostrea cuccullata TaxID=36930 RepID=UPI002ED050B5
MTDPRWYNLSENKSATQRSTVKCNGCQDGSYIAGQAVDTSSKTCTRTVLVELSDPFKTQWWMVDLQEIKSIYAIRFSFRDYDGHHIRQQQRLSGYTIFVSNSPEIKSGELCFQHNETNLPSLTAQHVCVSFGQYVQFINERITYIELCSLVVLGCNRGFYGVDCSHPCPEHCKSNQCFVTNGICPACANGYTGSDCNQACSSGMFGPDCSLFCSGHCKNNSTCNPTNGVCSNGCIDGWMDMFCNKSCVAGRFGPDCKNDCSGNCLNDVICDSKTGKCDNGCKPGYKGDLCNN